ncbi:MAG TPA: DNA translocase FtsK 4TM domain-containing protein [Thermoanaerobaculia bacterium]|nr:DNA translocase FtsK 4TM domain-containing protein [Thermoanaerobaculia bacterium]
MSIADARASRASRTSKRPERPTLSPEKGNELLGLALVGGSLLLVFSFATYHPSDPSLFHELPQAAPSRNWIGPAGAQLAALGFGFFGLSCFLLPLFLLVAGWRRLRRRGAARVVGRGFGSLLLLAALPGLCQLLAGGIGWRGETVPAGGAFGTVIAGLLDERMRFTGSLLVLASAVLIGAALVVQSTLGQALAAWRQNVRQLWQDATLARARRRERREKERARRRVITKHLQRVVEEKQAADARRGPRPGEPDDPMEPRRPKQPEAQRAPRDLAPPAPPPTEGDPGAAAIAAMTGGRLDLPLRIFNRQGPVDYGLRRVSGEAREARAGGPAAAAGAPASALRRPPADSASAPASAARAAAGAPVQPSNAAPRWEAFDGRDPAADVAAWRAGGAAPRGLSPGASPAGAPAAGASSSGAAPSAAAVLAAGRARAAQSVPPMPPSAHAAHSPQPAPQTRLPFGGGQVGVAAGALPPVNLLQLGDGRNAADEAELMRLGESIRSRCAEFGVEGSIEAISPGPVITVFEFQPAPGVKVSHIVNLQDDLALALKAESVRIERLPGRSTLGLEVPNRERGIIRLGSLLADERFRKSPSVLTMALGTTIYGEPYYADLATMPHLLVAGATGAGKSVGLQSMITSILYRATRDEVQFIFIDPKRIELGVYADIPHLKAEVVVDPKKAANALRWAVAEMERRYRLLAEVHVRSIAYYNRAICDPEVRERLALSEDAASSPLTAADLKPMPYYVVIIDELADLMMVSSSEVETSIARLAQMARAVGIHLIVATQRPSVDVLTGTIKANFPCRISYATASRHDSRTILDQIGSEKLLGRGDMLMMPPGSSRVIRLHGAYVSEQETASLVRWLKKQGKPDLDPDVLRAPAESEGAGGDGADSDDELYDEAARLVVAERQASASFLQRRMRIGFSRAARLIDIMERDGLLGPPQGSKPREVLVKPDYFAELDGARAGDLDDD